MKTLAIVDDNPDSRLLLRTIIGGIWNVDEYETGFQALKGFEHKTPDVVLMDISLPGMDGVEVLNRMRATEKWRGIPVIAVTAYAGSDDKTRFLAHGFNDYFPKPIIDEENLISIIKRWINRPGGEDNAT